MGVEYAPVQDLAPGAAGSGSFVVAKWDSAGDQVYVKKHGIVPDGVTNFGMAPYGITVDGSYLYVSGTGKSDFGGKAPITGDNAASHSTIAQFDRATGDLIAARQYTVPDQGYGGNAWGIGVGADGQVFVGGGDSNNGETDGWPDTSPFALRTSAEDITQVDHYHIIKNGNEETGLFTPENWQISNEAIGEVLYYPGDMSRGLEPYVLFFGYASNGDFFGGNLGVTSGWAVRYDPDRWEREWTGQEDGGIHFGASANDQYPFGGVIDANGDIYLVGQVLGEWDAADIATGDTPSAYRGNGEGYVVKIDGRTGQQLWARLVGGDDADDLMDVTIDDRGNLWATGSTYSDWGGPNQGMRDAIVVKMDPTTGEELARFQFGTEKLDFGRGIEVSDGVLYVPGMTEGSMVGPYSGRGWDVFVATFDFPDVIFEAGFED